MKLTNFFAVVLTGLVSITSSHPLTTDVVLSGRDTTSGVPVESQIKTMADSVITWAKKTPGDDASQFTVELANRFVGQYPNWQILICVDDKKWHEHLLDNTCFTKKCGHDFKVWYFKTGEKRWFERTGDNGTANWNWNGTDIHREGSYLRFD